MENIIRSQSHPIVPARAYYGYKIDMSTGKRIPTGPRITP